MPGRVRWQSNETKPRREPRRRCARRGELLDLEVMLAIKDSRPKEAPEPTQFRIGYHGQYSRMKCHAFAFRCFEKGSSWDGWLAWIIESLHILLQANSDQIQAVDSRS